MEYKNEVFPVKGMHCSKCASVIERTLMEMDGVENVNVNLSKKNASISYDTDKINSEKINEELKSIGYEIGHDFSFIKMVKGLISKK